MRSKARELRTTKRSNPTSGHAAICRDAPKTFAVSAKWRTRLVRAEITKHVQKIILTPDLLGKTYIASGNWDLLGNVAVTMVPGARLGRNSHSINFRFEVAA
jgi:hypothetical protein